jgi:hypothetical protein
MLTETFLDHSPVLLLYLVTVVLLLMGVEIGFRVGRRRRAAMQEGEKTPANAIMGSTLGLLAFMLAFTFGMAGTRFDARRQLVLEEASAVLRTYQRAQFLREPQRSDCSALLREYVEVRNTIAKLATLEAVEKAVLQSETVQDALWQEAASLADQPNAILAGFMQSLSELTDLQMKRVRAAVWNRIPASIFATLYVVGFLALTAMGYAAGLAGSRTTIPTLMLVLAFSAIIVLIVDLERPRQKLFQVNQEPMAEVARRMSGFHP